MARINGDVSKIVVDIQNKVSSTSDYGDVNITGTVYVYDVLNTPYPGLPIDLGSTGIDDVATLIEHSAADLYTLATTGSLP